MLNLLLNIGNTHTQIACENASGFLELVSVVDTPRLAEAPDRFADFIPGDAATTGCWQAYCACVVPALRNALDTAFPNKFHFITYRDYPWLDFSAYSVETLGADRIANAAAAFEIANGSPVMVIDCGTAINTEIIDATGHFLGGIILPGRAMCRQALTEHTAQLPRIPLDSAPPPLFGHTTAEAMQAGINSIIAGGLAAHLEKIRTRPNLIGCRFLLTGGDAAFFIPLLPLASPAPDNLTLRGVQLAQQNTQ